MPDLRQGCATGKTGEDTFLVRCIHASKAVALGCCSIDC